nr:uncharacterized protein LOC127492651 [Oryctolagus cuniculus]
MTCHDSRHSRHGKTDPLATLQESSREGISVPLRDKAAKNSGSDWAQRRKSRPGAGRRQRGSHACGGGQRPRAPWVWNRPCRHLLNPRAMRWVTRSDVSATSFQLIRPLVFTGRWLVSPCRDPHEGRPQQNSGLGKRGAHFSLPASPGLLLTEQALCRRQTMPSPCGRHRQCRWPKAHSSRGRDPPGFSCCRAYPGKALSLGLLTGAALVQPRVGQDGVSLCRLPARIWSVVRSYRSVQGRRLPLHPHEAFSSRELWEGDPQMFMAYQSQLEGAFHTRELPSLLGQLLPVPVGAPLSQAFCRSIPYRNRFPPLASAERNACQTDENSLSVSKRLRRSLLILTSTGKVPPCWKSHLQPAPPPACTHLWRYFCLSRRKQGPCGSDLCCQL